jgi:ElaB/YqjD/DUF883 family membrane-anchored ribosome-binding protein
MGDRPVAQTTAHSPKAPPLDETREALEERARELYDEARDWMQSADKSVRGFVEEQPLAALGGALVAGYLIGRALSRR